MIQRCVVLQTVVALAVLSVPFLSSAATAPPVASASPSASPMAGFDRLIGGEWQISILRHRFAWGIGQHTVFSRSYDHEGKFVAEARWFWHPGEKVIKGYSIDATGKSFAEMTTHFEGDTMSNFLEIVNPDGTMSSYTGKWVFTDDNHYDWTLFSHGADGEKTQAMQATASREAPPEVAAASREDD